MLREYSDRGPEPPRWKTVLLWTGVGVFGAFAAINVLNAVVTGFWNW